MEMVRQNLTYLTASVTSGGQIFLIGLLLYKICHTICQRNIDDLHLLEPPLEPEVHVLGKHEPVQPTEELHR